MKAVRLKNIDMDYRLHMQAFLNFAVRAERRAGKGKTRPVYTKFKKFYDYEKEVRQALGEKKPRSRLLEIGRLMQEKK